jgi:hypothetical protein
MGHVEPAIACESGHHRPRTGGGGGGDHHPGSVSREGGHQGHVAGEPDVSCPGPGGLVKRSVSSGQTSAPSMVIGAKRAGRVLVADRHGGEAAVDEDAAASRGVSNRGDPPIADRRGSGRRCNDVIARPLALEGARDPDEGPSPKRYLASGSGAGGSPGGIGGPGAPSIVAMMPVFSGPRHRSPRRGTARPHRRSASTRPRPRSRRAFGGEMAGADPDQADRRKIVPITTWKPWKPVAMKKLAP